MGGGGGFRTVPAAVSIFDLSPCRWLARLAIVPALHSRGLLITNDEWLDALGALAAVVGAYVVIAWLTGLPV